MKVVLTDIDGTLTDDIGIAWVRYLGANGYVDGELFEEHEELVDEYRRGAISHIQFTQEWISLYARMLRGKPILNSIAGKFFEGFKKSIKPSIKELLAYLKQKKFTIIAISASPIEPLRYLAKYLGISEVYATVLDVQDGRYTGEVVSNMHTSPNGKWEIVREILNTYGVDTTESIAMGDTIHDIPLLISVAYPLVINPKGSLKKIAHKFDFWSATHETALDVVKEMLSSDKKSDFEELRFLYEMGVLRKIPRSGWHYILVDNPEDVSQHVFRASIIAFLLAIKEGVDPYRCAVYTLFHEIDETRLGDLNKINTTYITDKRKYSKKVVKDVINRFGGLTREIMDDIVRYGGSSKMKDVCKDADLLENFITAREYEEKGYSHAREWIVRIHKILKTRTAKRWAEELEYLDPNSWWFGIKDHAKR